MKRLIKSLLVVSLFVGMSVQAWGQASTEGKDFWVANTIICQPPTASKPAFPTIAVSAQKACKVTITDYAGNQLATANVAAGSWTRFGENTAAVDPAEYYLDPNKWYPTTDNINATDVYKHADKINNYGLHITATENISVYVIMRTPQYSMDASNALPVTALQSEYYLQDFYPDANGVDKPITMTTILATENNTRVLIVPRGNTYGKNNNGTPYTITLNKGQTYYLISEVNSQLAGTHITAQDGKKIAVYVGSPVTRLPGGVSARDGLFEQMMPVDFWGTQFIVTRSMQKDGNIIGITATQNGTELKIDGYTQTFLNEGDTYYLLIQGPADPYSRNQSRLTCSVDQIITADAAYIETSCPCAVISYDTGNSFAGATGSEIVNGQGDPSSVWISPIQQKINRITFGACYTQKTKAHFLNIVTETATCSNTILTAYMGATGADWSNRLSWTPVPGNPTYSYARVQIGNNTETINVFTLENSRGFIAHVYGNGENESYAYSAGSAAVVRGINIDGISFSDGYIYDQKFCFGHEMSFDANVGTDEITRVDWDFGDGTTLNYGPVETTHTYTSPGWYDVTAILYGHQVCTNEDEMYLGSVSSSFLVYRPDTLVGQVLPSACISLEDYNEKPEYWDELIANGKVDTVQENCYDDVILNMITYRRETEEYRDTLSGWDLVIGYNGRGYTESKDVVDETINEYGCPHYIRYYVHVIHCLDMTVSSDAQSLCPGEKMLISYTKSSGDIRDEEGRFVVPGLVDEKVTISNMNTQIGQLELPTNTITKPGYYTGQLTVGDANCDDKTFPINIVVNYPSDIFQFKFNNVLAVYQNKGYQFTAYQWYVNGLPVDGATSSILYLGENNIFKEGDIVFVVLTDQSGMVLPSCAQTLKDIDPDMDNDALNQAPAQKVLINNKFRIIKGGMTYDIYGQRVQ